MPVIEKSMDWDSVTVWDWDCDWVGQPMSQPGPQRHVGSVL